MSTETIIFKLTPDNRVGKFTVSTPSGAALGQFYSLGATLETIAEHYGLDAMITWQWEDSRAPSFIPMTVREFFWALRPDKKENVAAAIARLEKSGKMGAF